MLGMSDEHITKISDRSFVSGDWSLTWCPVLITVPTVTIRVGTRLASPYIQYFHIKANLDLLGHSDRLMVTRIMEKSKKNFLCFVENGAILRWKHKKKYSAHNLNVGT